MLPTRPNFIDYGKAFMIYCVVLGHYTYALGLPYTPSPVWSLMHAITLFHMPFFFIVSGVLFNQSNIKDIAKKGWVQLGKPYLMMSLVCALIMLLTDGINENDGLIKSLVKISLGIFSGYDFRYAASSWSGPLWFCFSLFIIKIYFSIVNKPEFRGGFCLFALLR